MRRAALICLVTLSSSSCWIAAAVNSKPAASVEFASTDAPEGTGWLCFTRNDGREMMTLCERDTERCERSREREQRGGGSTSVCRSAPMASCYFIDTDPSKAAVLLPIGEKERLFGCFGSREECTSVRNNRAEYASTGNGIVGVSRCRELN